MLTHYNLSINAKSCINIIGLVLLIIFATPSVAFSQYLIIRRSNGVDIMNKLCAKQDVNIYQSVVTEFPNSTVKAFPVSKRPIIGRINRNQCRYMGYSEANYHYDGGYRWVLIVDSSADGLLTGWVRSEFFSIIQESVKN